MSTTADSPRRFLFVLWEGGGAVPSVLALARRLAQRGHAVRVLADPSIRDDAVAAGCSFVPFTRAPHRLGRSLEDDFIRDFETGAPWGAFARMRDRLVFGPALAYAQDVAEELARRPVDLVAADFCLLGAAAGAEQAGIPAALLHTTIYTLPRPRLPAVGPGFLPMRGPLGRLRDGLLRHAFFGVAESGLPALNDARTRLGLAPVRSLPEAFARAGAGLVLSSARFDYGGAGLPSGVRYVGAQLDDPAWVEPWTSPWSADVLEPLVVVGLSTTYQAQGALLQRVVNALGSLPVRGLVTTGPAIDPASIDAPGNVRVIRSAPHAQVFREASAVVTHAGHGTVMRALAQGLPLVCLPMGRDQNDVAARVVYHDAGVRLPPQAGTGRIREALHQVLREPRFHTAAARLGRAIATESREERGVQELERLAVARPTASRHRVAPPFASLAA